MHEYDIRMFMIKVLIHSRVVMSQSNVQYYLQTIPVLAERVE